MRHRLLSRRGFLVTGGAVAVVTGLGVTGYAYGPGTAQAREPWGQAGQSFGDSRLDALAYAILAPNPHNRQPWMFDLVGDDQIDVYCDLDRRLEHTDPYDRQITIGFGCMLELLRMAAAQKGYAVTVVQFPDGQPQPRLDGGRMASVHLRKSASVRPDPLFVSVLARRSSKEPYDTSRAVEASVLSSVMVGGQGIDGLGIGGTVDPALTKQLTDLAWTGWMIEYENPATRRESIDLMRIGNRAVVENPDGIDLGGTTMGLMKMLGVVTPEALDTPGSQAYETGVDMYREIVNTAMGFAWVSADENTRLTQMDAGRAWVRINLAAQAVGLCIHPLSQILQEFPEMAEPYEAAKTALDVPDGVVHMLGRLGYAKFPKPSPRWPLQSKLISRAV